MATERASYWPGKSVVALASRVNSELHPIDADKSTLVALRMYESSIRDPTTPRGPRQHPTRAEYGEEPLSGEKIRCEYENRGVHVRPCKAVCRDGFGRPTLESTETARWFRRTVQPRGSCGAGSCTGHRSARTPRASPSSRSIA